ncbi:ATP-binding protein [Yoonia sp.]|uniref:ATP-binding protein n=1 Tax=Yoonia sp. TaxID=2212373 RepID=UPI0025EB8854|nr:ATP-binding protein [Yoonia sp.]
MFFRWLKNYLPRGLYGRAALILILPVLTLQLLVSVVFIQRHFDGVTRLMTSAVNIELRFLVETVNTAADLDAGKVALSRLDAPLEILTTLPAETGVADVKPWTDLTGRVVIETLRNGVADVQAVSLADRRRVGVWVDTVHGPLRMDFSRTRVSASNPHQLLVIMLVMGVIMTTIAYFFLRNQLRPIKRMAAAAADYGKGRVTQFTPTGAVEVRAAGMAFLDMRNRLERQTQSRTMMLSGVSHDLRTPLTRLRLGLSLLDDSEVEPLLRDVDDMQHLLDAFLDFARSDAGDSLEPTVPQDLVHAVLADAERMGQPVYLGEMVGATEQVSLRPLAIRRALENLVGNALRYGTRAEIGVSVTERAVRFCVEDDGPGIPPAQREDAISPFVRLDPARNQDKGSGVGLGLSIVADIARTHGGVLRLGDSTRLGGLKAELVLAR